MQEKADCCGDHDERRFGHAHTALEQERAKDVLHWDEVPAVSEVGYEGTHAAIAERLPALIAELRAARN